MFAAWGRFVYRRRWPVLAVSGVLLLASIFIVIQGGKLQSGGFIETSESGRASRLIERELPRAGGGTFTLIFSSDALAGTGPQFRAAVDAALAPLRTDPRVATVVTPYDGTSSDPTQLISNDGHAVAIDVAVKDDLATAPRLLPGAPRARPVRHAARPGHRCPRHQQRVQRGPATGPPPGRDGL